MSSVMRPSGPLPPRVYWVRRLMALVVLVVAISVLWWCVQKVTGSADDSTAGSTTPSTSADAPTTQSPEADADAETDPDSEHPGKGAQQGETKRPRKHEKKARPLAPTGGCDVATVAMAIDVSDVKAGRSVPIKLALTTEPGTACTQAITPSTLVVRITSGQDVVWSSDDCPDKLRASEVVVRADPAGVYRFEWNGRRSTGSCAGTGAQAEPGGYWVEAALIGADSHRAFFDVTDG